MQKIIKKALSVGLALGVFSGVARADKGMWLLNELTQENLAQMKELGFKLSADELYNLQAPSVARSVVIFGRGCTGVTVSGSGLIMTNHHCGFSSIQQVSSVDHDYLRDGFVSQTNAEELPIEGLKVRYLSDIKDITPIVNARLKKDAKKIKGELDRINRIKVYEQELIKAEQLRLKNPHKEVVTRAYYAGNKYYMLTYDVFSDVRMVFAPPSSIGKFGGETDNWMWPRHTGDFAVFRVYADKDNKPANYTKDNVPYKPVYFASVSTQGYKEGDYAMTIGFPGSTERYIPSWGVESRMRDQNQALIDVRGVKQAIWRKAMDADQATRIKYADKYANSSNYWKNSIGMNRALRRLGVVANKQAEEQAFQAWADHFNKGEYKQVLPSLKVAYEQAAPLKRSLYYLSESLLRGTEVLTMANRRNSLKPESYKDYIPELDEKVLVAMLDLARKEIPASDLGSIYKVLDEQFAGDTKAYARHIFAQSVIPYANKEKSGSLEQDPAVQLSKAVFSAYYALLEKVQKFELEEERGNRLYFAGRQAQDPKRPMPSDANFTMRMSYGSILSYKPSDAVTYSYYTTPKGILEKYTPGSTEFDLPKGYEAMLKGQQWGRWADKQTKDLHVAFLSNNDITGGNSGSPVFDGNGRVIGLAFDGNWEAMSGDIEFEPNLQRTISVDIRYVLYVIEKWGKCPRLIAELDLK